MKTARFAIHWSATVYGTQYVEAFDEEDAREQFDSHPSITDAHDDAQLNAEVDEILPAPIKEKRK